MKNLLTILIIGLSTTLGLAQTGINTTDPKGTLDIQGDPSAAANAPQGVIFPKATTAQRNAWINPPEGLMIYNTDTKCIEVNYGLPASPTWRCSSNLTDGNPSSGGSAVISSFDNCSTASGGTLILGVAVSGVTQTITVTVATAGSYNISAIANGVTFNGTGTLATGQQDIVLTASGTPAATESSNFALNTTPNCSFIRNTIVPPNPTPANITLGQNQLTKVVSVYDTDYLPFVTPTGTATTNTVDANGTVNPTVDIQGSITTTGVRVRIPVTATGNGILPAFSQTNTIPAHLTEDGQSRDVTLSWASQSFDANTRYITGTIAAVGGTLNIKKLDINAGLGSDGKGVLLSSFAYAYNNAGNLTSLELRVIPVILDRMFGQTTNGALQHQFMYLPVYLGANELWLNMNLGAEYADLSSPNFDITVRKIYAAPHSDEKTFGSLFQWQRKPDGHELRNSTTTNSLATNWTASGSWDGKFIRTTTNKSWVNNPDTSSQNTSLWQVHGANNPCPDGYHVPTNYEWRYFLFNYMGYDGTDSSLRNQTRLPNLAAAGERSSSGGVGNRNRGFYASSEYDGGLPYKVNNLFFWTLSPATSAGPGRTIDFGLSVRCKAD